MIYNDCSSHIKGYKVNTTYANLLQGHSRTNQPTVLAQQKVR